MPITTDQARKNIEKGKSTHDDILDIHEELHVNKTAKTKGVDKNGHYVSGSEILRGGCTDRDNHAVTGKTPFERDWRKRHNKKAVKVIRKRSY